VATQRLLQPVRGARIRGRATWQADSFVQIITILGARRRELRASVGERLRLLDELASRAEARHMELEDRLSGLEGHLEQLDRARAARSQRKGLRRERIVVLRRHVELLREGCLAQRSDGTEGLAQPQPARSGRQRQGERAARREEIEQARREEARAHFTRAPSYRLGSVVMFLGCLLVVWVVLLELGLALGLT
jgi:hypothetical protein